MTDVSPERWKQIEALFFNALDLPEEERARFVASASNNDEELRREVETLLAQHLKAADYLETPAVHSRQGIRSGPPEEMTGRRVGAYRIEREIGRGGMGRVFMAERADGEYRQRVAVKIVKRGMDTDFVLRRFRNERQILAALEHPNIARLLDGGTTPDGLPYFVMEYIEGETMTQYADARRLTIDERLRLFQQVCAAVHYAHEHLVIHRDLKPSNILVTQAGTVKLLDFGIAKLLNPQLAHSQLSSLSLFYRPMTPEYASPEQVQGFKVTPASDQYSLGLLLYELLTGRKTYRLRTHAPLEMARVICEERPERPSAVVTADQASVASEERDEDAVSTLNLVSSTTVCRNRRTTLPDLRRELERGLDAIVLKALSKEPRERYASVAELSADIDRFLAGDRTLAASPEETRDEAARPASNLRATARPPLAPSTSARRRKAVLALAAFAVVAVAAAAFLYWRNASRAVNAPLSSIAVMPFVNASDDGEMEWLSDGITESIIDNLSHLPHLTVKARSSVFRYKGRETDPQVVGRELNVQAVLTGRIMQRGDELSISTELVNAGDGSRIWGTQYRRRLEDVARLQEEIARDVSERLRLKLSGADRLRLAKNYTSNTEAYQLYLQGRYYWNKRSADGVKKSIELYQQALEKDPAYALAYAGLSRSYYTLTTLGFMPYDEGLRQTRATALKAVELDDTCAEAHAALGAAIAFVDWNWPDSEKEFRRALELNPGSAEIHYGYGEMCLKAAGRMAEAIREVEIARDLDPLSIPILTNLGRNYVYAHQPDKGLELIRKALDMDSSFGRAHLGLVEAYIEKGLFEEAMKALQETNRVTGERAGGADVFLYAKLGQRERALKLLEALKREPQQPKTTTIELAMAYTGLGDYDAAFDWLDRAVEEHNWQITFVKVHPIFTPLHTDARYAELMRRVNVTP